ncbi:beta-ketoacyl synthase N-terminal-like domain-containing protein [Alkaliphilus transvaalensis]|uniref:beta-ketoacyl synthase N-terminal-like domain-containing protein n=1 Tax=Alkaliphilus transvaalensis TaxID=114628 RepID=UPI000478F6D2|nr:beta-ketoacyl synthase N-terminal-like domain-containing protein [Alkaliphilus transvaalensis]
MNYKTLGDLLMGKKQVTNKGICFINGRNEEEMMSYSEILDKSLKVLGFLQKYGLKEKDELIFQINSNKDFIHVFWACLLGGIIAVPVTEANNDERKLKVLKVWERLKNPFIISDKETLTGIKAYAEGSNKAINTIMERHITIEEIYCHDDYGVSILPNKEDIAFIQFSSGSTGNPKGVILTHDNLIANLEGLSDALAITEEDSLLSWMPLTHDMGLIACHLLATFSNIDQFIIPTNLFIRRPTIWLEKTSHHKASILQSPNFGYKYVMSFLRREKKLEWDLSSVRVILNGAEPIVADICNEFFEAMDEYHLDRNAMFAVYGLAEASVGVAIPPVNGERMRSVVLDRRFLGIGEKVKYLESEEDQFAATFFDEGPAIKHCFMRIGDEKDNVLEDERVGYIQISGRNVTQGYYNDEEKTREMKSQDGWVNTGDLGFMKDNRVVVIGRAKDVVFVNGQNYYAHDLERIAEELDEIELGKIIVTAVKDPATQAENIAAFILHKKNLESFKEMPPKIKKHFSMRVGIEITYVLPIKKVPKTTSGKVQRFNLSKQFEAGEFDLIIKELQLMSNKKRQTYVADELDTIERNLLRICKSIIPDKEITLDVNFFELGLGSLTLNQMAGIVQEEYGAHLQVIDFFSYPTIKSLAQYIKFGDENNPTPENMSDIPSTDIAIIGMGVHLPGATNLQEYWEIISNGVECLKQIPNNRKNDITPYLRSQKEAPDVLKFQEGGYLDDIDSFDYKFFKVMPSESIAMNPAQRKFLQVAYGAIEDAGYGGDQLRGSRTGVYVGYIGDLEGYKYQQILNSSNDKASPTGTLSSNICGRLSYFMDFKGPSMLVDTACSSSLVALHLACQGIKNGDCQQAIVGGVRFKILPIDSKEKVGTESKDWRTRTFDDLSDGTGEGEGVAAVLIKPLNKALEDKDQIYAVIKGTASNQDGSSIGLSAPNLIAQKNVLIDTYKKSNINPKTLGYIEAHGTGTPLGDPIEIQALSRAFNHYTEEKQFCAIGSVKANIGHLYEASGVAALIKCSLMLKYKILPPMVNFAVPNRKISFTDSPFYVNTRLGKWERGETPRRCGISNFGFSGTNCHVILEEAEERKEEMIPLTKRKEIFTISAKSKEALENLINKYIIYLKSDSTESIENICYTANVGRGHHQYRGIFIIESIEDLYNKLMNFNFRSQLEKGVFYAQHKVVMKVKSHKGFDEIFEEELEEISRKAQQLIINLKEREDIATLNRICQLYIRGAQVSWTYLYEGRSRQKVSLPTYGFEKNRSWPEGGQKKAN